MRKGRVTSIAHEQTLSPASVHSCLEYPGGASAGGSTPSRRVKGLYSLAIREAFFAMRTAISLYKGKDSTVRGAKPAVYHHHTGHLQPNCQSLMSCEHIPGICFAAAAVLGQQRRSNEVFTIRIKYLVPCWQAGRHSPSGQTLRLDPLVEDSADCRSSVEVREVRKVISTTARSSKQVKEIRNSVARNINTESWRAHLLHRPAPQRLHQQAPGCIAPLLRLPQRGTLALLRMLAAGLQTQRIQLPE